ncbi:hypothetical protein [Amycolatopsis nalaikhensis]|uniref:Uncharacterized protein n=1 Tax=Amycolatopsis nalaikhensis TaxID=715472 RepID=A0ABY8XKQ3_9PSEU|nr:hypothetical protein [Amycolatopsis sp. 2-2]WIV56204.1 hypothetical protein QP939_46655 [Amycolatopsis sp. 2-2]
MEEKAGFDAAFRRRIAKASRDVADARSVGDHDVARVHAEKLEDAFDLALRIRLDDDTGPVAVPRPRPAVR